MHAAASTPEASMPWISKSFQDRACSSACARARTRGVLAQQQHGGLGVEVGLVQVGAEERAKLVDLLQRPDLRRTAGKRVASLETMQQAVQMCCTVPGLYNANCPASQQTMRPCSCATLTGGRGGIRCEGQMTELRARHHFFPPRLAMASCSHSQVLCSAALALGVRGIHSSTLEK